MGCLLSGSMVGLMATSSKRVYATHRTAVPRAPAPVEGHCWPIPLQDILKGRSGSVSVGSLDPAAPNVLFKSSEYLWRVWGLILNMISPLLPSCLSFSFSLAHGVSFSEIFQKMDKTKSGSSSVEEELWAPEPRWCFCSFCTSSGDLSGSHLECSRTLLIILGTMQSHGQI